MKAFMVLAACALPLAAQDRAPTDSAKAAAIVARHVAAIGGEAALRAVTRRHMVMTMSMPGGAEVRVESWSMAPNLVYHKSNMPGIGITEMGYDGTIAWTMSSLTGPTILEGQGQKSVRDFAIFTAPLHEGLTLSYGGVRELGGRKLDVVHVVGPEGQKFTEYFDAESGLLAGMDFETTPPPPGQMSMSFEDYRRFDGILFATKHTTRLAGGQEMISRIVTVEHGPIDKAIFLPPPAVRQLSSKRP